MRHQLIFLKTIPQLDAASRQLATKVRFFLTTLLVFTKYNILWFKVLFPSGMAEYQVTSKPVSSTLGFSLVSFQRLPRPEKFPAVLTQVWDFGDNVVSLNVSHDAGGLALLATYLANPLSHARPLHHRPHPIVHLLSFDQVRCRQDQ